MREELLHFIWQFHYYNHRDLTSEAGDPLYIHRPGEPNTDQGPDFKNARITIGGSTREGPVELHLRTSDWLRHDHSGDPHYQQVILHVVLVNDVAVPPDGIPVLALQHRISNLFLSRYRQFMAGETFVPCERLLSMPTRPGPPTPHSSSISSLWPAFRQTLLHQRLQTRTAFIRSLLEEERPHWEETIFQLVARSLGQPVNTNAFLNMAKSIPLNYLLRRRTDPARLEALFLDQAARLDPPLAYLRMRPAHHPHLRLKQLAAILNRHDGWFTKLLESDHPAALLESIDVKGLGTQTKHAILINAFIPFLYAYGTLRQERPQSDKALRWLEQTPPENNTITRRWQQLGLPTATAADTQALLELRKNYCTEKKCLDCKIGRRLLATPPPANENQS